MDYKTASLIFGLVYTILPAITWAVLSSERRREDALWCGGGIISGFAICLGVFKESDLSFFVTMTIPYTIVFLGTLFKVQALRSSLGKKWPYSYVAISTVLFFTCYEFFRNHFGLGLPLLLLTTGFAYPILAAMLALLAREIGQKENLRSAFWLSNTYLILSTTLIVRVSYLLITGEAVTAVPPHYTETIVSIVGIFTTIFSSVGYIGMRLESTTQSLLKSRLEQSKVEHTRILADNLSQITYRETADQLGIVLAHELKQPFGAIKLDSEFGLVLVQSKRLDKIRLVEAFLRIGKNLSRADELINRLMQQGKPRDESCTKFDLNVAINNVVDLLAPQCRQCSVVVHLVTKPQAVIIRANELEISQTLINVIKNAIEASSPFQQVQVKIQTSSENKSVSVCIEDEGSGFDEELLNSIGTTLFTTKPDGLGLGIMIARELASRNNGKLVFSNRMPHGAAVEVVLPISDI